MPASSASTAAWSAVTQIACNNGTNQQFQLQDAGSGFVRIVARHSGKLLEISGQSTVDGAIATQWADLGLPNQRWGIITG